MESSISKSGAVAKKSGRRKVSSRRIKANPQIYIGGSVLIIFALIAIFAPFIATHDPTLMSLPARFQGPSAEHLLGTDNFGRDIFSRLVYGARVSMTVGLTATSAAAAVGTIIGIFAGYKGGKVDSVVMRFIDIMLAFPGLLLALTIVAILGASTVNIILALAIGGIPGFSRIVRAQALVVRKLEYVDAIKALGASDFRIITKHIFPNITSPIIVQFTLSVGANILGAAALSFLGMGTQPPTPEWGTILANGREFMYQAPHMIWFPGMAILLVVISINILGDGLRDAFEPRKGR